MIEEKPIGKICVVTCRYCSSLQKVHYYPTKTREFECSECGKKFPTWSILKIFIGNVKGENNE